MKQAYIYNTSLGEIIIAQDEQGLTDISLIGNEERNNMAGLRKIIGDFIIEETELIKEAARQFNEYLSGRLKVFNLKLNPKGTEFQKKVWNALCAIPYGQTRSYRQIAEAIGNPKACRAVGMANHNNPIMCVIPCHRVIGSDGSLVGYGGGLQIKKYLLDLEKGNVEYE